MLGRTVLHITCAACGRVVKLEQHWLPPVSGDALLRRLRSARAVIAARAYALCGIKEPRPTTSCRLASAPEVAVD